MKRVIPIIMLIALSMIISTDAATTGVNPTQYDYIISNPNPIKDETITIDTHVQIWETDQWIDMYQGMGEMRHHLLQYDSSIGSVQPTSSFEYDLSTDLEYEFTLSDDTSIFAIRLPISINTDDTQFVAGTEISIDLYQDTDLLLTFVIVDWEIIPHVADNKGIMIPINTVYTIMNQHDSGLALTKDTLYSLKFDFLNFPSGTTVGIPSDPGYSSDISLIAGGIQPYTPGFVLYTGTKLGETRTEANGMHSIDLTMNYGNYFYLATFFDEMTNWQRFMYIQEFDVVDDSNPYLVAPDQVFDYGANVVIEATARVNEGGAVLVNQEINLYERNGAVFDLVETLVTNTQGQVSFSLSHVNQPGTHEFMVETWYNSKRASDLLTVTINEPLGEYSGLQATGYYSSAGISSTRVTVEGYVIQQASSNPVASEEFEIYMDSNLVQTVTTDTGGYFVFDLVITDAVGVYTDLMAINYIGTVWGIADAAFDLQILKGMPSIDILDVQTSYIDQPFSFIGFVADISINPLRVDASLEYFDGENWIIDGSVDIAADGSLSGSSAAIRDAGQYIYQVRTVENGNFRSITKAFNVLIDSTDMSISRGGLDDPYYLEYHQTGDFSVLLLDSNSDPVVGESVTFTTNDVAQGSMIDLATVLTDENGIAHLDWIIPDANLALLHAPLEMIANHVGNSNYASTSFVFEYFLVPTTLEAVIDPGLTEFNSISTITIDINDIHGFDVRAGIDFEVDIDGSVYTLQSDASGELTFSHEYDIVGLSTFTVSYDRSTQLTENGFESFSHSVLINIDKGTFNIVIDNLHVSQGAFYQLLVYVEDVNLDPVEGVSVEVLLYNNIEWVSILTGGTSPSGIVTSNLLAELAPGIYSYKVVIVEGNQYYGATETRLLVVDDIRTRILDLTLPTSYIYGSPDADRYVELQLVVDNLNQPLSGLVLETSFGPLSFTNTTDTNGKISFHLPRYEIPGTVTLTIDFMENGIYQSTQFTLDVLVDGVDTIIDWIQFPSDTYYGEILSTSVVITDNMGNPLINYEVVMTINDLSYSRFSDSNGEVFFSVELRTDLGISTVTMELQGTLGFDPASISFDIDHDKRDLVLDISTSSGVLEAQFAYPTTFVASPYVIIDSVPYVLGNCIIEVYWADLMGGTWILIETINYDGNPFSITLPEQNVGVTQFIKFVAIEPTYHPVEMVLEIVVIEGSVTVVLTYLDTAGIDDDMQVVVTYTNYYSELITMDVQILYLDPVTSQLIYTFDPYMNTLGSSIFSIPAFDFGVLIFEVILTDPSGNYETSSDTMTVEVILRTMSSDAFPQAIDGLGYVVIEAEYMLSGVNGTAYIYRLLDGSWLLLGETQVVNGYGQFELSDLDTNNSISVVIVAHGFEDSTVYLDIEKEVVQVDISEQTVQIQLDTQLVFTVQGASEGMFVIIYYHDPALFEWVELGTLFINEFGGSFDTILVDLEPGYYNLALFVPEQIWFLDGYVYTTMHVIKKNVNLVFEQLDVYSNISSTITISTMDDNSDMLSGILVELWMDDEFITSAISVDGVADLMFTLDLPLGLYNARLLVISDDIIAASEITTTIYMWREANIDYSIVQDIIYTDGGEISVTVSDFDTGDPIADASVSLAYRYVFEWISLGSGITDETGIASIYVDSIEPGSYIMRVSMTQVDIYGSVSIEKTVTVLPETIDIAFDMVDYGITHNRTLSFDLFDETESISEGNIYWRIMTANDQVFDQGSFDIKHTGELIVPGDLVGDYYLSITYGHDSNYFVYNSELIIPDIGFDQLYTKDIRLDYSDVNFLDTELAVRMSANDSSLSGIIVLVYTSHTGYINLETDGHGFIHIPINYTLPGLYSIKIEIMSNIYFSTDFIQELEVTIDRADIRFDVEIPETVYYTDTITVNIDDTYLNSSRYEIRVLTPEGNPITISSSFNTSTYYFDYELAPGEYIFAVVRFNDLLYDEVVKHSIIIQQKLVKVEIDYEVNPETDTVDLIISGLFENMNINDISFNLTIHNGGVFYYVVNSSLTVNVYGTGSMEVKAFAMSPYTGQVKIMIRYDVTTVEISDPGIVDPQDTPEEGRSLFAEIAAGIITLGTGVQGIPILRKKLGK